MPDYARIDVLEMLPDFGLQILYIVGVALSKEQ